MAFVLPLRTDVPDYEFQTVLDGTTYTLGLRWNGREAAWYLDISTEDGDPISLGSKVVLNYPLAARCVDLRRPPGALIAFDTSGEDKAPGINELGARVVLIYHNVDDLPIEV